MLRRRWLRGRRGICHLTVRGRYDAVVLYLMLFVWGGGSCESSRCAGRRGVHSVDGVVAFRRGSGVFARHFRTVVCGGYGPDGDGFSGVGVRHRVGAVKRWLRFGSSRGAPYRRISFRCGEGRLSELLQRADVGDDFVGDMSAVHAVADNRPVGLRIVAFPLGERGADILSDAGLVESRYPGAPVAAAGEQNMHQTFLRGGEIDDAAPLPHERQVAFAARQAAARGYDGIPFLRNGGERFRLQLPEHRFPLLGEDAGDALPGSLLHQTVGIGESVSEGPCHAPAR